MSRKRFDFFRDRNMTLNISIFYFANVRGQGTRHFVTGTLDPLVGIIYDRFASLTARNVERDGTTSTFWVPF